MTETTRPTNDTPQSLYLNMAMDLGDEGWKLGFSTGLGQEPRLRSMKARDLTVLMKEIRLAKERFRLPADTPVRSCYEAGRDGFWIHRYLLSKGVVNLVVDSASIEVNRRKRRAKSDRLDVGKLLIMLMRYYGGEEKVWSMVHVPTPEEEDQRQMHRELMTLKAEQTYCTNQIKSLLVSQGVVLPVKKDFLTSLEEVELWDGSRLPSALQARLKRDYERYQAVKQQIKLLEDEREETMRTSKAPAVEQVRKLMRLKALGVDSAWVFVMEFFSWRQFHNPRELGALAGLTPTPYASGDSYREQGISKAGNTCIRIMAVEIACLRQYRRYRWCWLRYQPESELSQWYQKRFGGGNSRARRIGITALSRKLLVALWKYLERDELPQGASLKPA